MQNFPSSVFSAAAFLEFKIEMFTSGTPPIVPYVNFCKPLLESTTDKIGAWPFWICHRSLQNQPVGVESKPATLGTLFISDFLVQARGFQFFIS
jgi:hypothetical protein